MSLSLSLGSLRIELTAKTECGREIFIVRNEDEEDKKDEEEDEEEEKGDNLMKKWGESCTEASEGKGRYIHGIKRRRAESGQRLPSHLVPFIDGTLAPLTAESGQRLPCHLVPFIDGTLAPLFSRPAVRSTAHHAVITPCGTPTLQLPSSAVPLPCASIIQSS